MKIPGDWYRTLSRELELGIDSRAGTQDPGPRRHHHGRRMDKGTLNIVPIIKVSLIQNQNLPMAKEARAKSKCHRSLF